MKLSTRIKELANDALRPFGLRLETLVAARSEHDRLQKLADHGHFDKPVFPLVPAMEEMSVERILHSVERYAARFQDFSTAARNPVGYTSENDYFGSPDAEVHYCMVRLHEPATIVEVGSGHSTLVSKLAIMDGQLDTQLVTIDPSPRIDIERFTDRHFDCRVEDLADTNPFARLSSNDIVFIDSSHVLKAGNDVVHLYCNVIPGLPSGVLIHLHDIFLPYDYPADWVLQQRRDYNEQYVVQTLLQADRSFEVMWAGHYLQRTAPEFSQWFPGLPCGTAQSLWLRRR